MDSIGLISSGKRRTNTCTMQMCAPLWRTSSWLKCLMLTPVISWEHDGWRWCRLDEALTTLKWENDIDSIKLCDSLLAKEYELKIRSYRESDQEAVVDLWRASGLVVPWNDPIKDIQRKLLVQRDMFLVGFFDSRLVATVMAGYEGHRGWINFLAVDPEYRSRGFGRLLMAEAETRLRALGCPKINLQVRTSNPEVIEFYKRIGFSEEGRVSMGKRLEHG